MYIRVTVSRGREWTGLAAEYSRKECGWFLVPTTHNGIGREYHWDRRRPEKYRTKREALAARRAPAQGADRDGG